MEDYVEIRQKLRSQDNKAFRESLKWLFLVYVLGVVLRFVLALLLSQNPFILPDEVIYSNIARSILQGGGVALRNQPITYTNLLYSLLIAPAYALGAAGTQFRIIQFLNCLFMNLAVFPACRIAEHFCDNKKTVRAIALFSILIPDMIMSTRIMTEAIVYPIFLITILLMLKRLSGKQTSVRSAVLTAVCAFLLSQAKSGGISLPLVFVIILAYDCFKNRRKEDIRYGLLFIGTYVALVLLSRLIFSTALGINYAQESIYETQTQYPTLAHLEKTFPGLLLYFFYVPVAFGIFPVLLPISRLRSYSPAEKRQVLLCAIALAVTFIGACYMFFDSETISNFYQGRIHIRYVFMFLPVFLAILSSKSLEGSKPNGILIGYLGFIGAMLVTLSYSSILSGRSYPVDAILLSGIIYDDPVLNTRLLSEIMTITFMVVMLYLLYKNGWGKQSKRLMAGCLALIVVFGNWFGYNLNKYNDTAVLAQDAKQGAELLSGSPALLVTTSGLYFDNTLSVLDCAMNNMPYVLLFDDLCTKLGPYGKLDPITPPRYWVENPKNKIPAVNKVTFSSDALNLFVPANGAAVKSTTNGFFDIVTVSSGKRLFHSALSGVGPDGIPKSNAALYLYDESLLSQQNVEVGLQVESKESAKITLSDSAESFHCDVASGASWIQSTFKVPQGATSLAVSISVDAGSPIILTYRVK